MGNRLILVGDNPFHGVSHVSRERAQLRAQNVLDAKNAAVLVVTSINNGANGFTFTVSETTLSILNKINSCTSANNISLYPLVPSVNEFVRTSGATGGLPGLAKDIAGKMASVIDYRLLSNGVKGVICNDPKLLLKTYLRYEYLRLHNTIRKGKNQYLASILLHEIVTDMALALDMEWLFKAHIASVRELMLKPGFETRNLPYLVKQFNKWKIDFRDIVIEAPFNPIGFQMCPSRVDCENAINSAYGSEIIAFSILAAGYVKLPQALDYVSGLPGLEGVAIGVSNEKQAIETFSMVAHRLLQLRNSK